MSVSTMKIGTLADNFQQAVGVTTNADQCLIWVDPNCAGGQTALNITGSNLAVDAANGGIVAFEISGLAATFAALVDVTHTGTANTGTNWSSGTTAATTQASEIAIGTVSSDPGSLFLPGTYTNTTNSGGFSAAGYKILSTTGTQIYNGSQGSSNIWAAAIVTLKASLGPAFMPEFNNTQCTQAVMRAAVW